MKKLSIVTGLAAVLLLGLPVPAAAESGAPACPLTGDLVVELTDRQLLGWNDTENRLGPFAAAIPAGTYDLTLASYDDHSSKPQQGHEQPQEVWFLTAHRAERQVARSATMPDLPPAADLLVTSVGRIELDVDVTSLIAHHGFFDAYNPNSVVPLCASFTSVDLPAPAALQAGPPPAPANPPAPAAAPTVAPSTTPAAELAPASGSATAPPPPSRSAVADPAPAAADIPPAAVKGISLTVQPQMTELPNTGVHGNVAAVGLVALLIGFGLLRATKKSVTA